MGIFDKFRKKDPPGADFSDRRSGSSSTADADPMPSGLGIRIYVVAKGDTLRKIAYREYGDPRQWTRIFEANRELIADPNRIYPGQKLRLS
jgi:nucleoid-associated protein YgaU